MRIFIDTRISTRKTRTPSRHKESISGRVLRLMSKRSHDPIRASLQAEQVGAKVQRPVHQ